MAETFGVRTSSPNPMKKITMDNVEGVPGEFAFQYSSLIGALLYAATQTRLDVAFSVGYLARFSADPKPNHYRAALKILSYLLGSSDYGIPLGSSISASLVQFVDSDWAGDVTDRKSTAASVLFYKGSPVAWASKKIQSSVSLSSTEAEIHAAVEGVKVLMQVQPIFEEFGYPDSEKCSILMEDNMPGVHILTGTNSTKRA